LFARQATQPYAMRIAKLLCLPILCCHLSLTQAATSANTQWQSVLSSDGSVAEARHESGAVIVNGKLYLLGGRAIRAVQMFDPVTSTWTDVGSMPLELHHFQPVAVGDSIYVIGAFTCCYPEEPSIAEIHVFNTTTNTWSINGSMPASRVRGSASAVVRDNIIYLLGGNTLGHSGGAVAWFDSYNPATGDWTVLPDAPTKRDHFSAVIVSDYLVAAAGRQTASPNPFKNAVAATDMYDFSSGEWSSADPIPSLRAGALAAAAGDEIIVAGGEINTSTLAIATVEAMNVYTREWRALKPLGTGRHSGGGVVLDGQFHVVAGSLKAGGAPETSSHETLQLDPIGSQDFDADGLSNIEERGSYGTDPTKADTDLDSLDDKQELTIYASDPLKSDTDADGIDDGAEVNLWNTDPTSADSDADGLNDYDEAFTHNTDPLLKDSDADGLDDKLEVLEYKTDPANKDTDDDGINDGDEVESGTDPLVANSLVANSSGDAGSADGATEGSTEGISDADSDGTLSGTTSDSAGDSTGGTTEGADEGNASDGGSVSSAASDAVSDNASVGSVSLWILFVMLFASALRAPEKRQKYDKITYKLV